jgi:hypothetical protein
MAAARGVHVHFGRISDRGRLEESVDVKGFSLPEDVATKSDDSLVRRFAGLIYVPLTEPNRMPPRSQVGACPRRYRSRLPTRRTACKAQEDNPSP